VKALRDGFLLFVTGALVGWWLAHEQARRKEASEREAYANNPELVAVRAEIERLQKVEGWISDLNDKDQQ
jgi:hypothetical protein